MMRKHLQAALILFLLLMLLTGCATSSAERTAAALMEAQNPAQLYVDAIEQLISIGNFSLAVSSEKIITTSAQTFQHSSKQNIQYSNYGTSSTSVTTEQTDQYGKNTVSYLHCFENGTAHIQLNDAVFSSVMNYEDYCRYLVPVALLDKTLYQQIESKQIGSRILLGFSDPIGPESWAMPIGADFVSASGTVMLGSSGQFLEGTYSITYGNVKGIDIQVHYTVVPTPYTPTAGINPDTSVTVDNIFAPLALEQACSVLTSSEAVSSHRNSEIVCHLSGLTRTEAMDISLTDTAQTVNADINTSVSVTDSNRSGEVSTRQQAESFDNGEYTIQIDDNSPKHENVTGDAVAQYCRTLLVQNIPLLTHIKDVAIVQTGSELQLIFDTTESFAELICASSSQALYQDSGLLDMLSSNYKTDMMHCIVQIDALTGLPLSSSVSFKGSHTIDGIDYLLISNSQQTYTFP